MKTIKSLLFMLALFFVGGMQAQDFVDVINQSSTAAYGHRVIYEMNVGAFTQQGTFSAAQQRLSELKSLGVDIVWLMPIYPRGGGINSPYAARNFKQVNSSYGSIADLRNFVSKAHELNMLVWLDWVPNHTATDADWVTQHPEYYTKNNGQMVHPNGYGDVFELNYGNQNLQNAMNDCLKFWIDQADVDGYRCDYVASPTIPNTYWQSAISQLKNYRNKNIVFLAESNLTWDHYLDNVNVGFTYDYAWSFQTDLVNIGNGTSASSLQNMANSMINTSAQYNFNRMLYLTNHDQNWNEGNKTLSAKYGDNRYLFTVFYYTLYGMPLLYNGQEIGGEQGLNYFTDDKVNWNNVDNKMRNTVRTLCALKHSQDALGDRVGVNWLNTNNGNVLAYTRKQGSSEVLVILNLGTGQKTVTISGLNAGSWNQWLNSNTIAQGVSRTQLNIGSSQSFTIPAKGYSVYVREGSSSTTPTEPTNPTEVYTPYLDNANEVSVFFETPNQDNYSAWVWGDLGGGDAYCQNTNWPGDALELKGRSSSGAYIYKFTVTKTNAAPSYLIISKNSGNTKIYDGVTFTNHGYYVEGNNNSTKTITALNLPPVLTPYMNDGSDWHEWTEMTINAGTTFALGPQANQEGSWSWTGPNGFKSTSREITISNATQAQAGNYVVTFTTNLGATASLTFKVNVNVVQVYDGEVYTPRLENANEVSIFFETPNANSYSAWVWGDLGGGEAYCQNTNWPGDALELKGRSSSGAYIYKFTVTKTNGVPSYLIISKDNGNTKIYDGVTFTNHGYYVEGNNNSTQTITAVNLPPVITPYMNDGSEWHQWTEMTIDEGTTFALGPQANQDGSWAWTGPNGFTSSNREVTFNNATVNQSGNYVVTFTANTGASTTATMTVHINAVQPPVTDVYTPSLDNANEVSVFFETPNQDNYSVWAWGDLGGGEAYCQNTNWPGDAMQYKGRSASGGYIYKITLTKTNGVPSYLIISKNNGNNKIYDGVTFVNHGYYVEGSNNSQYTVTKLADEYAPYLDNGNEVSVFFETPNEDNYSAWAWGDLGGGEAYCQNTNWPGDALVKKGRTASGNYIYKFTITKTNAVPSYLIISKNNGNTKIYDGVAFVNHGYYVEGNNNSLYTISAVGPMYANANLTEISTIETENVTASDSEPAIYTIYGVKVDSPTKSGIYIVNGKKVFIRR